MFTLNKGKGTIRFFFTVWRQIECLLVLYVRIIQWWWFRQQVKCLVGLMVYDLSPMLAMLACPPSTSPTDFVLMIECFLLLLTFHHFFLLPLCRWSNVLSSLPPSTLSISGHCELLKPTSAKLAKHHYCHIGMPFFYYKKQVYKQSTYS